MEEGASGLNSLSNSCSLFRVPKISTLHTHEGQSSQTLQIKHWESPLLLLEKASGGVLLSMTTWTEGGPSPRQRSLANIPSGTTSPVMYQKTALQQDCWVTPLHERPQVIKHLRPCIPRRLDGAPHFLSCFPRSCLLPRHMVTHTWTLLLRCPFRLLTKPDLRGLSCSPWWVRNVSTAFRNLMPAILYSNAQYKCLLRAYY